MYELFLERNRLLRRGAVMKKIVKINCYVLLMVSSFYLFLDKVNANWLASDTTVECGSLTNIPARIPAFTSMIITVVQVIVPVLLVIFGVIDLLKAMSSQKEDDIQKGRQVLIKRIIIGFLIFFVIAFSKLVVSLVVEATDLREGIIHCIDCFVNNSC